MSGKTILIVDDHANIRELAEMYLQAEGFQIFMAENGEDALSFVAKSPPDLLILDLMLPGIDGWEVCRQVRAKSRLPILMLTARDDDIDKIIGLEMGADDYLTKPFNPRELVARVRAIFRRVNPTPEPDPALHQSGNVTIDPPAREVRVNGKRINLRAKEFDLLLTLIEHTNQVLSRDQLLDLVWGYEFYGQTRTVDVHIAHLRDKLAKATCKIETVWGMGYKLVA